MSAELQHFLPIQISRLTKEKEICNVHPTDIAGHQNSASPHAPGPALPCPRVAMKTRASRLAVARSSHHSSPSASDASLSRFRSGR